MQAAITELAHTGGGGDRELMPMFGESHLFEEMPQVWMMVRRTVFEVEGRGSQPSIGDGLVEKIKTISFSIVNH